MGLPTRLHKYFWDINPRHASPKVHPEYYIKRVLEIGDQGAVDWAVRAFGKKRVVDVAKKNGLSPKSKNFWHSIFK